MRITVDRLGIMLDQLCFEVLGTDTSGVVERTLELNAGLAEILRNNDQLLPLGITLNLPDPDDIKPKDQTIKLWD